MMTDGYCQKIRGIITYQQSYYLALESEPASQRGFENRNLAAATKRTFRLLQPKKRLSEGDFRLTADKVLGGFRRRNRFSVQAGFLYLHFCVYSCVSASRFLVCATFATSSCQIPRPCHHTRQHNMFSGMLALWSSSGYKVHEVPQATAAQFGKWQLLWWNDKAVQNYLTVLSVKPRDHLDKVLEMSSSAKMEVFLKLVVLNFVLVTGTLATDTEHPSGVGTCDYICLL